MSNPSENENPQPRWASNEELFRQLERDIKEKRDLRASLALDISTAWAILATLQLGLSHPDTNGPIAIIVQNFVDQLATMIATTEAEKEIVRRGREGYSDAFDVVPLIVIESYLSQIVEKTCTAGIELGMPDVAVLATKALTTLYTWHEERAK